MPVGHYENFPVASALLPRRLRTAVVAIYHFARAADDIADEGNATAEARLAELARYAHELDAIERGETPPDPLFAGLAAAVREHRLPLAPLRNLLSAFAQDVSVTRYASFDALADYCRRSANPVGRLLLALYDRDDDANRKASDAICTGLQLANFWQDVAVDWRKGRVYLPREDLDRFGVPESQIAGGVRDERWSRLMRFETQRTRVLFATGRPLVRNLPWRAGIELAAVIAGGTRILERIDAVDGDVFGRRPTLGMRDWMIVAGRALVPRRKSMTPTS
ncbi:MAG TPA: squalene synthase HpnC [Casimicrobiaceae bacterium]|nr:squalene synthase HpnC [Casimicrobiaceae bacterium]